MTLVNKQISFSFCIVELEESKFVMTRKADGSFRFIDGSPDEEAG